MSATLEKIPLPKAEALAEDFARLFPPACYTRWQVAGSVRRQKPFVGDLEFVVIPAIGEIPGDEDMFGARGPGQRVNLLWQRVDDLVKASTLIKVETNAADKTRACWGDRQRRVLFRGHQVEIYSADNANWGSLLTIRTGPEGFSKHMVEQLRKLMPPHCHRAGYVRKLSGRHPAYSRGEETEPVVECPTEEMFFGLCGMRFIPPESRKD